MTGIDTERGGEVRDRPTLPSSLVQPAGIDVDGELRPMLPSDHPAWRRDTVALSYRARAFVATLRPLAVRVFGFWQHRVRSIKVGGRTLNIDAAGSYRL